MRSALPIRVNFSGAELTVFDVSFSEILFIIIIALAVLGPEGLPEAARRLGRMVAAVKQYLRDLADEVSEDDEARKVMKEVHGTVREIRRAVDLRGIVQEIEETIDDGVTEVSESIREVKEGFEPGRPSDPYFTARGVHTGRHFRIVRPGRTKARSRAVRPAQGQSQGGAPASDLQESGEHDRAEQDS